MKNEIEINAVTDSSFFEEVASLLTEARKYAKRQIDNTITVTYYQIGRMIVEREQQGEKRARYGAQLIKGLSAYLTKKFGDGFSTVNLKNMRKFYLVYSIQKGQTLSALFENDDKDVIAEWVKESKGGIT